MEHAANPARKARALSGLILAALAAAAAMTGEARAACVEPETIALEQGEARFRQTRRLKGSAQPLVSTGVMTIAGQVLSWRVNDPVQILTVIGPDGITQSVEGGAPERLGQGGDSYLASSGLLRVLTGDLTEVRRHYTVARGPASAAGWTLTLTPKDRAMAQHLSRIELRGCTRVDGVIVRQTGGDSIEIDRLG